MRGFLRLAKRRGGPTTALHPVKSRRCEHVTVERNFAGQIARMERCDKQVLRPSVVVVEGAACSRHFCPAHAELYPKPKTPNQTP